MKKPKKSVLLIILDGWGHTESKKYNAIYTANTPNWDKILDTNSHAKLKCSGCEVGLPSKQMGNSEVGHMHLGSGRLILQDLSRINSCISRHDLSSIELLSKELETVANHRSTLHLIGLLSPGGVHSHIDHLEALIKVSIKRNIDRILIHGFLDGRDTAPTSASESIERIESICRQNSQVEIASLVGRYYGMDRNKNWERTKIAHDLIASRKSKFRSSSAKDAIKNAYSRGETDEFMSATAIKLKQANYDITRDSALFFNFRADRARQITASLSKTGFNEFSRQEAAVFKKFLTMTDYGEEFQLPILFPQPKILETLGQVISDQQLKQMRIAETEKYAHVTFFFNGGREAPFPGEERILIPSPDVSTYDLKPEMSASEVTESISQSLKSSKYDLIVANFANADMVGHTGIFDASVKAVETLDSCLGKIVETAKETNVEVLITADHGNIESMCDSKNAGKDQYSPHTAHTNNEVPIVYLGKANRLISNGELKDVAPTILDLLGIVKPDVMTGQSLFEKGLDS